LSLVLTGILPEYTEKASYICAIIELEKGVRMPANILDCELE